MATRYWAGVSGSMGSWDTTPVDGDTGIFTDTAQDGTSGFSSLSGIDFAAVKFSSSFSGRIGDENSGWELECDGDVTNVSKSAFIHLTGGAAEDIVRVVHSPTGVQGQMLLSDATVGNVVVSAGKLTVRGDVTLTEGEAVGTGYLVILAGAGSYGGVKAYGRSQVDVWEDPASSSLNLYDQCTVRILHADGAQQVNMFGGRLVPRGGELAGFFGLGGVLDLSELTADLEMSGTIEVGPDLHVIAPPAGFILNITGTVAYVGGRPTGYWPANYA